MIISSNLCESLAFSTPTFAMLDNIRSNRVYVSGCPAMFWAGTVSWWWAWRACPASGATCAAATAARRAGAASGRSRGRPGTRRPPPARPGPGCRTPCRSAQTSSTTGAASSSSSMEVNISNQMKYSYLKKKNTDAILKEWKGLFRMMIAVVGGGHGRLLLVVVVSQQLCIAAAGHQPSSCQLLANCLENFLNEIQTAL